MPIVLSPITSYPFNGANQSPLDPTNWFEVNGGLPGADVVQILGNVATTTVQVEGDGTVANTNSWPNDQYSSIQLKRLTANGGYFLYCRANPTTLLGSYVLSVSGPFNDSTGLAAYSITQSGVSDPNPIFTWANFVNFSQQLNDVITFGVIGQAGGILFLQQNGVTIFQGNLSDSGTITSSGTLGFQFASLTPAVTDIAAVNWVGGSASGSSSSGVVLAPDQDMQPVLGIQRLSF